jgi:hypothetical protein
MFIDAIHHTKQIINKAYDLFSMMDGVDKHLAVIEDERRLMGRVLEDHTKQIIRLI